MKNYVAPTLRRRSPIRRCRAIVPLAKQLRAQDDRARRPVYLYTLEFGVVREEGVLRVCGADLLSWRMMSRWLERVG